MYLEENSSFHWFWAFRRLQNFFKRTHLTNIPWQVGLSPSLFTFSNVPTSKKIGGERTWTSLNLSTLLSILGDCNYCTLRLASLITINWQVFVSAEFRSKRRCNACSIRVSYNCARRRNPSKIAMRSMKLSTSGVDPGFVVIWKCTWVQHGLKIIITPLRNGIVHWRSMMFKSLNFQFVRS